MKSKRKVRKFLIRITYENKKKKMELKRGEACNNR